MDRLRIERMRLVMATYSWPRTSSRSARGPVNAKTGEPLNWFALPVVDKRWNTRRADKGGFIQEHTGWKPSVLQPYVYLPSLMEARGPW